MLKYYSYYNVGGYKDMFLGDSSMEAQKTLRNVSVSHSKKMSGSSL